MLRSRLIKVTWPPNTEHYDYSAWPKSFLKPATILVTDPFVSVTSTYDVTLEAKRGGQMLVCQCE